MMNNKEPQAIQAGNGKIPVSKRLLLAGLAAFVFAAGDGFAQGVVGSQHDLTTGRKLPTDHPIVLEQLHDALDDSDRCAVPVVD